MTLQPVNKVSPLCCLQYQLSVFLGKVLFTSSLRSWTKRNFAASFFFSCSMTRRLYFYRIWALSRTGNLLSSSVKLSQLVIQVHMVDFLFLVERLRRYFLHWFVYLHKVSSRKRDPLLCIWREVSFIGFFNATSCSGVNG